MWLLLALLAASFWGTADFLGGLAAKLTPALRVLIIGMPAGLVLLLPFVIASGEPAGLQLLAWGAASGLASGAGTALLYSALGAGPMKVVAPLSATSSAVVPIAVGLLSGERPGRTAALFLKERLNPSQIAGVGLAATAIVLMALG